MKVRLVPQLFSSISRTERADPAVHAELSRRVRAMFHVAAWGNAPSSAFMAATLWGKADSTSLIFWVAMTSLSGPFYAYSMLSPREVWSRRTWAGQIWAGLSWGMLPIIAMPADPAWQVAVAAYLIGVMAANVILGSPIRALFYQFHIPLTILATVGIVMNATGAGLWGGGFLVAYSAIFAAILAEVVHRTALDAAVLSVRNSTLAAGLAEEHELLEAANKRLDQRARTDPLTGLANRLELTEQLETALAQNSPDGGQTVALAYVDLDGFKAINDTFGHRTGDVLLRAVSDRLRAVLTPGEVLARQGGDELVVMSPRLDADSGPKHLADRLESVFVDPIVIDGTVITVSATLGIASADVDSTADGLLRQADAALYQGKADGRGKAIIFDRAMNVDLERRQKQSIELDEAIERGQIVPYLQPVVDLVTGEIVSAEALARWEHPDGVRSAASFIEIAAHRGLMPRINRMVLAEITSYLTLARSGDSPTRRIAVNTAADHLHVLLDELAGMATLDGLEIEITEHSAFGPTGDLEPLVAEAHRRGATVVLDDFGTGYSSLAMAMQLDVDGYKVDRMFVDALLVDEAASAVTASIVELASRRGRNVIAEGIETVEHVRALRDLGVSLGQGYLFSPAVPIAQYDEWLSTGHRFDVGITATHS